MITIVGGGPVGRRGHLIEAAIKARIPVTRFLVFAQDFLAELPGSGSLTPITVGAGPLSDATMEAGLIAEWQALRAPLPQRLEDTLSGWVEDAGVQSVLVRMDSGDPFGTALASGRAAILRSIREVRAAAVYNETTLGTPEAIVVADVKNVDALRSGPPEAGDAESLLAAIGIEYSIWCATPGGAVLVDAGGPEVHPADPWSELREMPHTESLDSLAPRLAFGRLYNRLLLPDHPLEWVSVMCGGGDSSAFLAKGEARYGPTAKLVYLAAVESVRAAVSDSAPAAGGTSAGDSGRGLGLDESTSATGSPSQAEHGAHRDAAVRQVIGRAGTPGHATGQVRRPGEQQKESNAAPEIFVCDHLEPSQIPLARSCAAIVERRGSGFGLAALLSRDLGVPHVYGVTEAGLLRSGAPALVNGSLGIVTITSQA